MRILITRRGRDGSERTQLAAAFYKGKNSMGEYFDWLSARVDLRRAVELRIVIESDEVRIPGGKEASLGDSVARPAYASEDKQASANERLLEASQPKSLADSRQSHRTAYEDG